VGLEQRKSHAVEKGEEMEIATKVIVYEKPT
jgi:hypothetical protein